MSYPFLIDVDRLPWQYHITEHKCPDCGEPLTKVDTSRMLVCDKGHGPYFLT